VVRDKIQSLRTCLQCSSGPPGFQHLPN
jgi:hypothetical protein